MAITISGQNNNDKILASDGVLDSISGFNVVGVMTAGQFDVTGKTTTNHISIGSNIHLGNAGIITATTLLGNVTGNINHESNLLLQISGSEKFRVGNGGQFGIAGANYGSAGQVFTSGGSGSAPTWSTIASDKITEGNTEAEVVDTGSDGHFKVTTEGSERLRILSTGQVLLGATSGGNADTDDFVVSGSGKRGITICSTNGAECRLTFADGLSGVNAVAGNITYDHSVDRMDLYTNTTRRVSILSNGKVGVNTTGPSQQFTSYAASGYPVLANGPSNGIGLGGNGVIVFGTKDLGSYAPGAIDASTLEFKISGTPKFNIHSSGTVMINTTNSSSRQLNVKGSVGVLSPSQTGVMDMSIDDSGNFELGAYHSSGGSVTLKTAPAGLGNQTRLNINKDGQLTHTTNKSSEYTARFVQAHADNPAWIEIDSPQDNNLRPAYIQFKNAGNNKWGIGQVYNPTGGQSFHICEGSQSQSNSHFVIKSNNYVGINTNNPQSALHVRGAGGIRIDTLGNANANQNDTYISDGNGNPIASGTPWFTTGTYAYAGSYSGMRYYWIKIVESQGTSSLGYIEYMAHGDSNYPRATRGTIAIASYSGSSRSLVHDQQTQEAGTITVRLASDGTVWMRLANYDWNSDFRFRLVYGEQINLNSDFTVGTTSSNSHGRIDTGGGGGPVGTSNDVLPGANVRYNISAGTFDPSGTDSTYSGDTHRFFKIDVANQLIKGSGSFRIDHPLAGMSTSHYLQHSFVEGPQADNLYRGKTTLVAGISTVNVDIASSMTDGTFVELNTDVQCFTTNETGWTPIKGTVSGNKLTITAQDNSCTDTISWMVVGERQDAHIKNKADWTDSDGKVIVELPKPNVGFAGTEAPYEEFK